MNKENWKPLPFCPKYIISDQGQVARILKGHSNGLYYWSYCISKSKGVYEYYLAHRLVAETWISSRPFSKAVVRHLNGKPDDNRAKNLAWGTFKENSQDAVLHGKTIRGEKHHGAKLTEIQIRAIKEMIQSGAYTQQCIADAYGVSPGCISLIKCGKNWDWAT